jgi:iron complex outermembrane receptor protein
LLKITRGNSRQSTDDYWLADAAIGTTILLKKGQVVVSLGCTNLFDKAYYDHLSRFKYFGIYNMGRNVYLNIHIPFN